MSLLLNRSARFYRAARHFAARHSQTHGPRSHPAGITRHLTAKNAVIFGTACRDCPLREQCTTAKDGRTLHLHEHDGLLRAARAAWAAGAGLREDYVAHRPHVERAIAQIATWRGRRIKLRYRGEAKNNAWLKRRTAAVNLRNLLSHGVPLEY